MDYKIISAIIGLVSGVIGSFFTPWVKWEIEKIKLKHKRRSELINEWRSFIETFDFENKKFGDTTVYSAMRPYMTNNDLDKFENPFVFHVTNDKRGDFSSKHWASDIVTTIEKQWKLL